MANSFASTIDMEGQRRVQVHVVGVLDTNDQPSTPIAVLTSFFDNNPNNKLVGFAVERIQYDGTPGLVFQLAWNSSQPQTIAALDTKADLQWATYIAPNRNVAGFDGSIIVSTRGFVAGRVMSFNAIVYLIKQYNVV